MKPPPHSGTLHFWYSRIMHRHLEGRFVRVGLCLITGKDTESPYTSACDRYLDNGGLGWPDVRYLGEGVIVQIPGGRH